MVRRKFARHLVRIVGILIAITLIALGLVADILLSGRAWWLQPTSIGCGVVWAILVFRTSLETQAKVYVSLAALVGAIMLAELTFRLVGYDFAQTKKKYAATPIFFRTPTEPLPPIYFRRPGPDEWRGKALTWWMKQHGLKTTAYADEKEVHIRYDAEGFRNPKGFDDWQIAVAGDSFTELGYLADEHLFTTILAKQLNVGVKNLGVTDTATLTQLAYLEQMGVSASTKHWVIVFFEGNDPDGLRVEMEALDKFRASGERGYRVVNKATLRPQTSLLAAAARTIRATFSNRTSPDGNAVFTIGARPVPISIRYVPPNESELPEGQRRAIRYAIENFATAAAKRNVKPWLVYMPCKHRVCDAGLRWSDWADARLKRWSPSDLPQYAARLCRENRIAFIDPTEALRKAPALTFNSVGDTHLNQRGSRIVAAEMAAALRGE